MKMLLYMPRWIYLVLVQARIQQSHTKNIRSGDGKALWNGDLECGARSLEGANVKFNSPSAAEKVRAQRVLLSNLLLPLLIIVSYQTSFAP